jgi:Uma2 family endonuclease
MSIQVEVEVEVEKEATIEDLYNVPENGKAELINGRLVRFMPTGPSPNRACGNIYLSLRGHERPDVEGQAFTDNAGFLTNLPHRKSFSPDASWYVGAEVGRDIEMDFFPDPPVFAAEVRSKEDYGQPAERRMAEKRHEYFTAGTLVVWDVDLLGEDVVRVHCADDPDNPVIFRRGEIADAEPAVPGWRMPVDDLFR